MQALRSDKVAYYEFDFHKECSRMRWDRVRILLDRVRPDYNAHGAFAAHRVNDVVEVKRTQQGVFRHNCIDCLDRTNVVQSMLAKDVLYEQLRMLGILPPTETLASHQTLNHNLDNIWADNADMLAMQYGGSKALKTDFTRTGHRTLRGMLAVVLGSQRIQCTPTAILPFQRLCIAVLTYRDAMHSISQDARESLLRYYKNNFTDGFKQDALDLLLGNYRVHSTEGVASISPVSAYSSVHIRLVRFACHFPDLLLTFCLSKVDAWASYANALFCHQCGFVSSSAVKLLLEKLYISKQCHLDLALNFTVD
eukprot:m.880944 g.880944  ORF g.880944 m.880944 type:complete len:309 (+) comp23593_c0_seq29:1599-2525(+)